MCVKTQLTRDLKRLIDAINAIKNFPFPKGAQPPNTTQLLLKLVNVQTPYYVVFKVVILVFCCVPSKFMYDQYWNLTPLSGRLYKRKTSKPSRKYNVGSLRDSLD